MKKILNFREKSGCLFGSAFIINLLLSNIWKTIITQVCKFPPMVRQTVDIKLDSAGYTVSNK